MHIYCLEVQLSNVKRWKPSTDWPRLSQDACMDITLRLKRLDTHKAVLNNYCCVTELFARHNFHEYLYDSISLQYVYLVLRWSAYVQPLYAV